MASGLAVEVDVAVSSPCFSRAPHRAAMGRWARPALSATAHKTGFAKGPLLGRTAQRDSAPPQIPEPATAGGGSYIMHVHYVNPEGARTCSGQGNGRYGPISAKRRARPMTGGVFRRAREPLPTGVGLARAVARCEGRAPKARPQQAGVRPQFGAGARLAAPCGRRTGRCPGHLYCAGGAQAGRGRAGCPRSRRSPARDAESRVTPRPEPGRGGIA